MCVIWIYVQNSVKHQTAFIFTIPLEEPCLQKRVLYFMEKLSFDYMLDHWFKRWYRVVNIENSECSLQELNINCKLISVINKLCNFVCFPLDTDLVTVYNTSKSCVMGLASTSCGLLSLTHWTSWLIIIARPQSADHKLYT